jgi:hypothetical protein
MSPSNWPQNGPDRLGRRGQAGFGLAIGAQGRDAGAEIERLQLAPFRAQPGAQRFGRRHVDRARGIGDHAIVARALGGHQTLDDLQPDERRIAFQRIAPAAAAPGDEMELIAGLDHDILHLVADDGLRSVGLFQNLARALARQAAVDPPGWHEPAVVVDRDRARGEEAVGHVDAVAAAMQPGAAAVGLGLVALDGHREIALQELVGDIGEPRPQRMPVGPVAHRPARNAAEADLEQLEPLALAVGARIEQVRG